MDTLGKNNTKTKAAAIFNREYLPEKKLYEVKYASFLKKLTQIYIIILLFIEIKCFKRAWHFIIPKNIFSQLRMRSKTPCLCTELFRI